MQLAAAALALLLLAVTAAATAAATFPRQFDWTVRSATVRHEWTYLSRGYPRKCRGWIKGRGFVEQKAVVASGSMEVDDNGAYKYAIVSAPLRGSIERVVTYRGHAIPQVQPCVPCGPLSEWGECKEVRPDVTYHDSCGPRDGRFELDLALIDSSLYLRPGMDGDVLDRCPEIDESYADPGPGSDIAIDRRELRGAGRRLLRMRVGAAAPISWNSREGSCSRLGKVGEHECVTVKATIVFRRTR